MSVSELSGTMPRAGCFFDATRLAACVRVSGGEPTLIVSTRNHLLIKTESSRFMQLGLSPTRKEEKPSEKEAAA
jgi:hypothetical protein